MGGTCGGCPEPGIDGADQDYLWCWTPDWHTITFTRVCATIPSTAREFAMDGDGQASAPADPLEHRRGYYDLSQARSGRTKGLLAFETFGHATPEGQLSNVATVPRGLLLQPCRLQRRASATVRHGAGPTRPQQPRLVARRDTDRVRRNTTTSPFADIWTMKPGWLRPPAVHRLTPPSGTSGRAGIVGDARALSCHPDRTTVGLHEANSSQICLPPAPSTAGGLERVGTGDAAAAGAIAAPPGGALVLAGCGRPGCTRGAPARSRSRRRQRGSGDARPLPCSFETPFLAPAVPNPRHLRRGRSTARAAIAAAVRGGRRNGVRVRAADVELPRKRLRRDQGDACGYAARYAWRSAAAARAGRAWRVPIPVRARATAELVAGGRWGVSGAARPAAATRARSPTGRASRCGPTSRSRSIAWRRRPRVRPGPRSTSPAASAQTPSRPGCSPPSGPEVGRAPGRACTARHRARPRPGGGVRLACGQREAFGFVQRYSWEPWHFGYTRAAARRVGFGCAAATAAPRGALPSFVPAALRAGDPPRGAALERLGGAAGRPALRRVELQPFRALAGRRPGHRPVHARHRCGYGPARPVRPRRRRSTPRRA